MKGLTLLYYTANRISYAFMHMIRAELPSTVVVQDQEAPAEVVASFPPIVTVTQKPDQWGQNICVGPIGASIYNCYRQILIGAQAATTPYVACIEDDTLYVPEHFAHRPTADDVITYNRNRWVLCADGTFYFRARTQMAMCLAPRALLIETLEERFRRWPEPITDEAAKAAGWGEPGRYERHMGLTPRRREYFTTAQPCVTVNHQRGLMGVRKGQPTDTVVRTLEPWGDGAALWARLVGKDR
jgi:hypothetical protein